MSDETKKRTFQFEDSNGKYAVEVWCDGRDYDRSTEAYRPRYSYKIVTPDWEYEGNDIRGAVNEGCDVDAGAKSLFAFLYACQEGFLQDPKAENENARLFPPHVREWAYMVCEELSAVYHQLEEGIA